MKSTHYFVYPGGMTLMLALSLMALQIGGYHGVYSFEEKVVTGPVVILMFAVWAMAATTMVVGIWEWSRTSRPR